ncbi:glycosyltransferase family 4 protein [Pseudomonadota bacterium]
MILHDVSHTSHSSANSGIQHVVRRMQAGLSQKTQVLPVCFDPYAGFWRKLHRGENRLLSIDNNTRFKGKRNIHWSYISKVRGVALRQLSKGLQIDTPGETSFLTAEIFNPVVYAHYSRLFPEMRGPKVAVFHDAIALRLPEFTPEKTCLRIPQYMMELLDFEGIAAVSKASADDLRNFWESRSVPRSKQPVIRVIPNASSFASRDGVRAVHQGAASREVLMVSTIEGRKNHLGLLKAAKTLWDENRDFTLRIIGGLNPRTGSEAHQVIADLKNGGYPVMWDGAVSGAELARAYKLCRFTVYPSLWEGFGLPVVESLSLGKPCVCTPFGGLKEVAAQGGCLVIEDGDPKSIANGMRQLLEDDTLLEKLIHEANKRRYPSWGDHASEMLGFFEELKMTGRRCPAGQYCHH